MKYAPRRGSRLAWVGMAAAVAVLAASCSGGPGAGAALQPPAPKGPHYTFVAIGGAETLGFGASDPPRNGWAPLFYRGQLAPTVTFVDLAAPGLTAGGAAADELPVAAGVRPKVVALWLGAGDLVAGTPPATFAAQLGRLIASLRTAGASTILVANLTPFDRLPAYLGCLRSGPACRGPLARLASTARLGPSIDALDAAIGATVGRTHARLVDVHQSLVRSLQRSSGADTDADLGLDDAGQAAAAEAFRAAFVQPR